MEWLMNSLVESDQREVDNKKNQLQAQRKFAGLTVDEKIEKLNEIKANNDAYYREQKGKETLADASADSARGGRNAVPIV